MDRDRGDYTLPELDDNSFPALTHLGLFWIHDMDTFQRIWDSPALTKKLTSLKLIPTPEFCFYTNIEFSDTLVQIFSVLAERSPSLQALWLRALHPDTSDPFYEASLPAFAALQILPLQSLYVDGIHFEEYWFFHQPHAFDDESVAKREAFIKHFATAFPALRELGFPLHTVPWTDCPLFHSHMPQLESLRFNFNLGTLKGKKVDLNNVPRCRCSPFRTLEANFLGISEGGFEADIRGFRYGDATRLVNYLFSIWPNVQIAAQPDGEDFEDYTPHYRRIALINNHLAALSLCNRDASIKYGDIKILNKESWARCEA
ncbi:hypothetical protein FRC08_004134 [Ceratobasidium sp. 394]|nr:hypothetical protein FRC08_004134 [Ceratobasidium sp. 394]KAG9085506.1 hypothetical protein FS749_004364 [Ceratobasidium sp. UAMH 11750]